MGGSDQTRAHRTRQEFEGLLTNEMTHQHLTGSMRLNIIASILVVLAAVLASVQMNARCFNVEPVGETGSYLERTLDTIVETLNEETDIIHHLIYFNYSSTKYTMLVETTLRLPHTD